MRNKVTSDNTTENVDKDGINVLVGQNQLEGGLNGLWSSTTTTVQEVGWITTVQLDHVHGGHGQTGTVHQTTNVTLQLDKVQVALLGNHFVWVFLSQISPGVDFLLSERGIVVETELGVHAHHLLVLANNLTQWVDFDLRCVLLLEDLVQLEHGILGVGFSLLGESQGSSNLSCRLLGQSNRVLHVELLDSIRVSLGNVLNVHTTLARADDQWLLGLSVHQNRQVRLVLGINLFHNVNTGNQLTLGTRLLRDQVVPKHLAAHVGCLLHRVDHVNTRLHTVVKVTLTSTTGQSLSLHNKVLTTQLLGNLRGFLHCVCCCTARRPNTVLSQQFG